jgi:hypothetical protein
VMSALNKRARSTGSTIECSRRIADTRCSSVPIFRICYGIAGALTFVTAAALVIIGF